MIAKDALERLAELRSDDGIVSFYLRMEPRLRYEPGLAVTKLKSAYTRFVSRETRNEWLAAAEREYDRILELVNGGSVTTRGLALFACTPADIWETFPLAVPVPTALEVDTTPQIGVLTRVLDDFPRILVCLVQRDKAVLYSSEQHEAAEGESLESPVPGAHDAGGFSQARFERHIEYQVRQHLREVVERIEEIHEDKPFKRLMLGGTHEVTKELESLLPDWLREKLAGTFTADLKHDGEDEILKQAREVAASAERREEAELVTEITNEAASGGRGVLGPDATLRALVEGRTQKLILDEDAECLGLECHHCEYLATGESEKCPACGESADRSANVIEQAIERAYGTGVEIEFVSEEARDALRAQGGIGALLRY